MLEAQASADKEDCDTLIDPLNRQKQIEKLQKQAERIEKWLEENDAKIGANGRELQSNVTDNESAKMMSSHGTIQGYNAQALVDKEHQVIMQADSSNKMKASNSTWPSAQILKQLGLNGEELNLKSLSLKKIKKKTSVTVEKQSISYVLDKTGWNRSRANKILGISYKTLLLKIQEFDLTPPVDNY